MSNSQLKGPETKNKQIINKQTDTKAIMLWSFRKRNREHERTKDKRTSEKKKL